MLKDAHFHKRNLPHIYLPEATYFITFRLKGSLQVRILSELKSRGDFKSAPPSRVDKYYRKRKFLKEYDQH